MSHLPSLFQASNRPDVNYIKFKMIGLLPGEPNYAAQSVAHGMWKGQPLLVYCSGNNLVLLAGDLTQLQTIYLDTDAFAVDINSTNGIVAVAIGSQVHLFEPQNEFSAVPRWQFLTKLVNPNDDSHVNTLSWGGNSEIIVGTDNLALWSVEKDFGIPKPQVLWSLEQANPVYLVKMSQDSTLIASCSKYDRLLKVWNRLSFGENTNFDLTYLPHPTPVSVIRWKVNSEESYTNVLYSLSEDQTLRVWSSYSYENSQSIQNWGNLRLNIDEKTEKKFVLILDDRIVTESLKSSIAKLHGHGKLELAEKKQPDIALVIDQLGNVEVLALENLSQNPPKMMTIKPLKSLRFNDNTFTKNPQFLQFAEPMVDKHSDISLIVHDLHGMIRNIRIDLKFLVSDASHPIGRLTHKLTGHNKSIQRIFRTSDGEAMLTTSRFEENYVWEPQNLLNEVTLKKKSVVDTPEPISQAVLLEKGNILLSIVGAELILWDTSTKVASQIDTYHLSTKEHPLFFTSIPMKEHSHLKHYVIVIFHGCTRGCIINDTKIQPIEVDDLPIAYDEIHIIAPIDPVGQIYQADRALISAINSKGFLKCISGEIHEEKVKWIVKHSIHTEINDCSYIRGSSISKFAIVDASKLRLTIWDLNRNVLEYEETFEDVIRDIDWTSNANDQSILAVGFENYSLLYTQQRYDYTNRMPTFQVIKKIDITSYTTHSIGDSIWLKDGTLVIGAGNQMFVADKELDLTHDKFTRSAIGSRNIVSNDIFNLSSVLNGSLPLYHPQFLIQLLFQGKVQIVKEILLRLFLKVRELEMKGENLEKLGSTLAFDTFKFFEDRYDDSDCHDFEEPFNVFNGHTCDLLKEKLTNYSLPYLTRHQQITLLSTIETIETLDQNVLSLDENGLRFFLGMKLFQLHKGGSQNRLTMRDINWALHSENKELLLQIVEQSVKDRKLTWNVATSYGLSYWVKYDELIKTFEVIAKNEFTLPERRDPGNCAIYYLALKKKQILIGLWRTAAGHAEQSKMLNFLKNDFRESRWKSAALKNAFVLMSKHRYMDAACFFLLADSLKDSANVLIKQVKDIDLAIAVCRVYEGDNGLVLKQILTENLLSTSVSNGDRWTTSYIYWKLKDKSRSIQSLVKSPAHVISQEERSKITLTEKSRSFLEDDPLLIVLYKNLREKSLHYFHGSLEISTKAEFDFIVRVSTIYSRMGCDYLSINLLKNWNFLKVDHSTQKMTPSSPTSSNIQSALEKYGLSPASRRRSNLLHTDRNDFLEQHLNDVHHETQQISSMSILEKYGLASDSIKRKDDHEENKSNNHNRKHVVPPHDAFKEPDMSSFDFGF